MPLGTNRRRATVRALLTTAVLVVGAGLVPAASAVAAAPAPVVIDDFNGNVAGARTVTRLPLANTSTTPQATFTESGGVGVMSMTGSGNAAGGVQLDYALPNLDLTQGGSNTQFFLTFPQINRTGTPTTSANISVSLTGGGVTGTFGTGVGNVTDFNIVLNFSCAVNPVCFSPQPDFTHVTHVTVSIMYPQNYDSGTTTVRLDSIKTTPTGGAIPDSASPTITSPADPTYGPSGTSLTFPVDFTSAGQPVSVYSTATGGALGHDDVTVGGTAPGASTYSVAGSGSHYSVTVGPLTGDGTVTVSLAAGVARDSWAQPTNAGGPVTVHFAIPVPPTISGAPPLATVGSAYSFRFGAVGTPAPAFSLIAGTLPSGLTLASDGTVAGTPAAGTGGSYPFTVRATNSAGTSTAAVTLVVHQAPAITTMPWATFVVGQPASFTFTATGFPTPSVLLGSGTLPTGLTFVDHGDGTATLAGTPTSPPGLVTLDLVADNAVGSWVTPLTIEVDAAPAITSAGSVTFVAGQAGSFTVTTTGYPAPGLTLVAGAVPAGLTFVDNHDGTATIAGTPAAAASGTTQLTVRATSTAGTAAQTLTVEVDAAPAFTSAERAVFLAGHAGSFTVTSSGYPAAALSLTAGTLPDGLTFADNGDGTATIAGTPTGPGGPTLVAVGATSAAGTAAQQLTVDVAVAPAFTSADHAVFVAGQAGSFAVTTSGLPSAVLSTTPGPLPGGLTFVNHLDGTATIEGTPAGPGGSGQITLRATSAAGTATQVLTIEIDVAPAITNADHAVFVVGQAGSFTVAAAGLPAPGLSLASAGPLPDGLSLALNPDGSMVISGTPSGPGGTVQLTVWASNRAATAMQQLTLEVDAAPAFTGADRAVFSTGHAGSFTVTTSGFPAPVLTLDSGTLPAGLTFVDNADGTATISGTPTAPGGTVPLTVRATNQAGTLTRQLTVEVDVAPAITSAGRAVFVAGQAGSFTVTSSGFPVPVLTVASGTLPAGLTWVDNGDGTATLSGTPAESAAGDHTVGVRATAGSLPVDQQLTIAVKLVPAFTSPASASFQVGVAGRFTVTAVGVPTPSFALSGTLPPGLTFVDNGDGTATIAGTPTGAAGSYSVTVNATNDVTDPEQTLVVLVAPAAPVVTAPADPGTGSDVLATTGTSAGPLLALAGLLVAAGAVLATVARRARRAVRPRA